MSPARAIARAWPVIWIVIVLADIVTGVTATSPEGWASALFILVFFTVMSKRFMVPGLVMAPAPAAPLAAVGVVAVAVRGWWIDGAATGWTDNPSAWVALVLAVAAIAAVVAGPMTAVRETVAHPVAFPLREGRWLAVEGNGRILNHHWVVAGQRGAFDLVRLSVWGRSRAGFVHPTDDDFHAFGVTITSPCDGRIVSVVDGVPDGVPDTRRPAGNHVVIDTGTERIVLAHMRVGTVAVSDGDVVRTGDRLGEVGNSGNSSEPHLHIHAERDGRPLRLVFTDVTGRIGKGSVIRTRSGRR